MKPRIQNPSSFIYCMVLIYLSAIYLCYLQFLNWDVASLLKATENFLKGGNYINDFFTPNPPMILYIYSIPVLFAKLTHLNIIIVYPLFIFSLATASLMLSSKLIFGIFSKEDRFQAYAFLCVMAFIFLILPYYDFGERDHILLIMTMPYILLTAYRLQNDTRLSYLFTGCIGILAGIAIAMKPQFLVLPLSLEIYSSLKCGSWRFWRKPETLAIAIVLAIYLIVVLLTRPDYVYVVLPFLKQNYYKAPMTMWLNLVYDPRASYFYPAVAAALILNKVNTYKNLANVLLVALFAFIFCYFSQLNPFYYHILPAFALTILVLTQIYFDVAKRKILTSRELTLLAIAASCFLLAIYFFWGFTLNNIHFHRHLFFTMVVPALGLAVIARQSEKPCWLKVAVFSFVVLSGYGFSWWFTGYDWLLVQMGLILVFMLVLFTYTEAKPRRNSAFIVAFIAVLFVMYPAYNTEENLKYSFDYKENVLNPLIIFMNAQYDTKSIYTMSANTSPGFPLNYYVDKDISQRFDALWYSANASREINQNKDNFIQRMKTDNSELFFVNLVVEDITRNNPDLIIVQGDSKDPLYYRPNRPERFNFLKYFLINEGFREVWQRYQYMTTLRLSGDDRVEVFKRVLR
jgi:hypothetical protein